MPHQLSSLKTRNSAVESPTRFFEVPQLTIEEELSGESLNVKLSALTSDSDGVAPSMGSGWGHCIDSQHRTRFVDKGDPFD